MKEPLVSIVIPVYNREKLVKKAIDSSLKQTYKNLEIVIVDNHSTDNTWGTLKEYAKSDKRIKIYRNEKNLGPVRNWKKGIEYSKGEFCKLLFSDDEISENYIEKTAKYLKDSTAAFVITKIKLISPFLEESWISLYNKTPTVIKTHKYIYSKIFGRIAFPNSPGAGVFRTRDLLEGLEINIPNEENLNFSKFGAGNDLLIFLNIAFKYEKVIYVDDIHATFLGHANSFSTANKLKKYYDISKLYFCRKNSLFHYWLILRVYRLFIKYDDE